MDHSRFQGLQGGAAASAPEYTPLQGSSADGYRGNTCGEQVSCSCFGPVPGQDDPGEMAHVGRGSGAWVRSSVYQWVGKDNGDYDVVRPRASRLRRYLPVICGVLGGASIVGALVWGLYSRMASAASELLGLGALGEPAPGTLGECVVWGAGHVRSFDGGAPAFFTGGDHFLLVGGNLTVQGRFAAGAPSDVPALTRVAIGGRALGSHTVEVGCAECGPILVNGRAAMPHRPSDHELPGLPEVALRYDASGALPDPRQRLLPWRVVHLELPLGEGVEVFRWGSHVDLRISARRSPSGGRDGVCGNHNGDPADDTARAVMLRAAAGTIVPAESTLFGVAGARPALTPVMRAVMALAAECTGSPLAKAQMECGRILSALPPAERKVPGAAEACDLDYCLGGAWGQRHGRGAFATARRQQNLRVAATSAGGAAAGAARRQQNLRVAATSAGGAAAGAAR